MARRIGRGIAIGVVLFGALLDSAGDDRVHRRVEGTLVWLGWYEPVRARRHRGLAHYTWTRANDENLFVLGILLTLSAVFLHFTFVNLLHIYLTRRFVPAALPLVVLFFAYAVTTIGTRGGGVARWVGVTFAVAMTVGGAQAIISRSRHVYEHREASAGSPLRDLAGRCATKTWCS